MTALRRIAGGSLAKVLAAYAIIVVVFAGAWLWSLSGPLTQAVVGQQQNNLTAVARSTTLLVADSEADPGEIAEQVVERTDLRLTLVASDGTVLADSHFDPQQMENHGSRPEVEGALDHGIGVDRRRSETEGNEQLYVAVAGSRSGERVAVRVSQPLDEIREIAARWRRLGLGLLATALAVALVVATVASRAVTGPVRELSRAARRMADGNLTVPMPPVPADLESLSAALTSLGSQVGARLDALEAERASLRATLDGLADAVLVLESDRVLIVNRAATEMFKSAGGSWEGVELDASPLPASLMAAIKIRLQSGGPQPEEMEPDPTGRSLRFSVSPLRTQGAPSRTIVVIADVTERARLDRVRRDFVANASHELKTPVAGIRLLAESAEAAASDGHGEQAVEFARQIRDEVARLQHVVGDLLDLSRLESVPAPDAIADVRAAVSNALLSHRAGAQRRCLALSEDFSAVEGIDVYAAADPTDLAVALDNLLDNAIAYTDDGGVTVEVAVSAEEVSVAVKDTGRGIAAEHVARIFERFYRVDAGRSRESGGTGLGLALVRHVAERNGGAVTVESEPGRGSTFTLRLPRRR